eukprot:1111800-Pelagomonas_calceolata.AAC.1
MQPQGCRSCCLHGEDQGCSCCPCGADAVLAAVGDAAKVDARAATSKDLNAGYVGVAVAVQLLPFAAGCSRAAGTFVRPDMTCELGEEHSCVHYETQGSSISLLALYSHCKTPEGKPSSIHVVSVNLQTKYLGGLASCLFNSLVPGSYSPARHHLCPSPGTSSNYCFREHSPPLSLLAGNVIIHLFLDGSLAKRGCCLHASHHSARACSRPES